MECNECIICFENIYMSNSLIMECCNQVVHKKCLESWTKLNIDKITDISYCFYCKQKNATTDYVIDIINNSNNISQHESNNIVIYNSNRYNNKNFIIYIYICITFSIILIIYIFTNL